MATSHALLLDTAEEIRALQVERWRAMSPARRLQVVEGLWRDTRQLASAGIRERYPDATPDEIRLRLGALTIDADLMIEAFGWDPEREGR
jgi:hypothetical protein